MSRYEITEKFSPGGFKIFRLTEGKFAGVEYSYSRVAFEPSDDNLVVVIDYDVTSGEKFDEQTGNEFGQYIGNILMEILQEQLASDNPQIVYKGGI
jgi:hypothetical protein